MKKIKYLSFVLLLVLSLGMLVGCSQAKTLSPLSDTSKSGQDSYAPNNVIGDVKPVPPVEPNDSNETYPGDVVDPDGTTKPYPDNIIDDSKYQAYYELMKNIETKYQNLFNEVNTSYINQLEAKRIEILGEEYATLSTTLKSLQEEYDSLYTNQTETESIIALKEQLNVLAEELSLLTTDTTEYENKLSELNATWNQISAIFDTIASKAEELKLQILTVNTQIQDLYQAHAIEMKEAEVLLKEEYSAKLTALNERYNQELKFLQESLGIYGYYYDYPNGYEGKLPYPEKEPYQRDGQYPVSTDKEYYPCK